MTREGENHRPTMRARGERAPLIPAARVCCSEVFFIVLGLSGNGNIDECGVSMVADMGILDCFFFMRIGEKRRIYLRQLVRRIERRTLAWLKEYPEED